MDQEESTVERIDDQEELARIASLIRPLPENVVPSDEFVRRMRMRILKLEGKSRRSNREAA
jgi:hypothetical protein